MINSKNSLTQVKLETRENVLPRNNTTPQVIPTPHVYNDASMLPSIRFAKSKKEEHEQGILGNFCKVQVKIPLLDATKQVPRNAKFLKEFCTAKH